MEKRLKWAVALFYTICISTSAVAQFEPYSAKTFVNKELSNAKQLELINQQEQILFLNDPIAHSFGLITPKDSSVYCCIKPEKTMKSGDDKYNFLGRLRIADTLVSIAWSNGADNTIMLYYKSYLYSSATYKPLNQFVLQDKTAHVFVVQCALSGNFVVGVITDKTVYTTLVSQSLRVLRKSEEALNENFSKFDKLESFLDKNDVLYLALGKNLKKKKQQLRLVRYAINTNLLTINAVGRMKFITNDFKITATDDGDKIALAGTMPQMGLDDTGVGKMVIGLYCLEFNPQLKMISNKNVLLVEEGLTNFKKLLGEPKSELSLFDSYLTPIGNFRVNDIKYCSEGNLVAVFQDMPSTSEYYFGNVAIIDFYANNEESVLSIPSISKLPSQTSWNNDTLKIDYVLDVQHKAIDPDKNNKLRFYSTKNAKYDLDYAVIRDSYYQGNVKNDFKLPLNNLDRTILGYVYSDVTRTLFLVSEEGAFTYNRLYMIDID